MNARQKTTLSCLKNKLKSYSELDYTIVNTKLNEDTFSIITFHDLFKFAQIIIYPNDSLYLYMKYKPENYFKFYANYLEFEIEFKQRKYVDVKQCLSYILSFFYPDKYKDYFNDDYSDLSDSDNNNLRKTGNHHIYKSSHISSVVKNYHKNIYG